ncbi:MAG: ATP-binding protein [Anaerolineales bacterium]|nr:ATP-binding protein [Anaerolineales bacterium]
MCRGSLGIDSLNNRRRFKPEEIERAGLLAAIGAPAIESALRISDADRQSRTDERARIRDDLHDLRGLHGSTVLVELQLAQFRLQALLETPGKLVSGAKRDVRMLLKDVTKTFEQAKFVNDQLLYIMQDLIDPVLAEEGLTAAVDNFIHKHVKHGSPIEFNSNLVRRLEPSVEHTIYRIAQEAVVNAIRHGIRNQPDGVIHVSLVDRDEQVELAITDNGCGFDPDSIRPGALGIYAMRQRAGDLNGRAALTVDSHVSLGTTVRLCVDLSLPQEFEKWPTLS